MRVEPEDVWAVAAKPRNFGRKFILCRSLSEAERSGEFLFLGLQESVVKNTGFCRASNNALGWLVLMASMLGSWVYMRSLRKNSKKINDQQSKLCLIHKAFLPIEGGRWTERPFLVRLIWVAIVYFSQKGCFIAWFLDTRLRVFSTRFVNYFFLYFFMSVNNYEYICRKYFPFCNWRST